MTRNIVYATDHTGHLRMVELSDCAILCANVGTKEMVVKLGLASSRPLEIDMQFWIMLSMGRDIENKEQVSEHFMRKHNSKRHKCKKTTQYWWMSGYNKIIKNGLNQEPFHPAGCWWQSTRGKEHTNSTKGSRQIMMTRRDRLTTCTLSIKYIMSKESLLPFQTINKAIPCAENQPNVHQEIKKKEWKTASPIKIQVKYKIKLFSQIYLLFLLRIKMWMRVLNVAEMKSREQTERRIVCKFTARLLCIRSHIRD